MYNGNGENILIVDDEPVIRRILSQRLSADGYSCLEASNAEDASGMLKKDPVSLVTLDVRMPGKSGVEFLPEIKASYPDTAIIMATAISDAATAIACMKQGAYDYVIKPFNLEEVALTISRALEKRRLEFELREFHQLLGEKVEEQAAKIRDSFINSITSLANALEAKDKYTAGHSKRVSEYSAAIARELSVPTEEVDRIRLAGLVHNIGKIGVKEAILNKNSRLTDEEFKHITRHCEIGEHILNPIADDTVLISIVRHHHERCDGKGYPDKLKREDIPLGARILAVVDSYDAMTSERPYRHAMTSIEALKEINRCAGTQFDSTVVESFGKLLTEGDIKP